MEEIISAIVGIFILIIFAGALLPALQEIGNFSGEVFVVAVVFLFVAIILSLFKR